jgi:hypothetical protein
MEKTKNSNFNVEPYIPKENLREYKKEKTTNITDNLGLFLLAGAGLVGSIYFGDKILNNEINQLSNLEKMLSELGVVGSTTTCFIAGVYSLSKILEGIKEKYDNVKNKSNDFKSKLNKPYKK